MRPNQTISVIHYDSGTFDSELFSMGFDSALIEVVHPVVNIPDDVSGFEIEVVFDEDARFSTFKKEEYREWMKISVTLKDDEKAVKCSPIYGVRGPTGTVLRGDAEELIVTRKQPDE